MFHCVEALINLFNRYIKETFALGINDYLLKHPGDGYFVRITDTDLEGSYLLHNSMKCIWLRSGRSIGRN